MKLTQTLLLTLLITLTAFTVVGYTACKKDPCRDVTCLNGGTCSDGICKCKANYTGPRCEKDLCAKVNCLNDGVCVSGQCQCAPGYEGDSCQVRISGKFAAEWVGTGQCAPHQYDVSYIRIESASPTSITAHLPGIEATMTGNLTSFTTARLSNTALTNTMTLDSANLTYMPQGDQLVIDYFMTVTSSTNTYQLYCTGTYKPLTGNYNSGALQTRSE
ncbi:EB domain-containing protein [Polluticoccus soli]|uniref:EB domain-containing protein n=1 Tax=Polluticoccus soli TaxID=3034150 RepID=UPI0023E1BB15|nr:EB domain-containing protein [Flavipsychrobacter sp. JY13-12]